MRWLLEALRRCNGGTVAIEEDGIRAAARDLARGGLFAEATSATAAAAFDRLRREGRIGANETTIVVLTGGGLKTTGFYQAELGLG